MKQILNTLYVTSERAYLHLDHDTLRVEVNGTTQLQVPLHHLGGVVCFGDVLVSPALIHRCAEDGRSLVFLDRNGRFKARVEGRPRETFCSAVLSTQLCPTHNARHSSPGTSSRRRFRTRDRSPFAVLAKQTISRMRRH